MTQHSLMAMSFSPTAAQGRTCDSSSAGRQMMENPRCSAGCFRVPKASPTTGFRPPKRGAEHTAPGAMRRTQPRRRTVPQPEHECGFASVDYYRYFETDKRKFVAIDVPGHLRYTRNMAEGCVGRRPCPDPRQCAQGRTLRDPPPQLHRLADGDPPGSPRGRQNGPRGLRPAGVLIHRRRLRAVRPRIGNGTDGRGSGVRADRRERFRL